MSAARDRTLHSAQQVHERLMVLLGGRAAERAVCGQVSSGLANDVRQANALARSAVTELGSPRAPASSSRMPAGGRIRLAETTHQVIDEEVERMIAEAYRDALTMLEEHRTQLGRLACALLASDELDRLEIAAALGEPRARRAARPASGPRLEPALRSPEPAPLRQPAPRRALRARLVSVLPGAFTAFLGRAGRDHGAPAA